MKTIKNNGQTLIELLSLIALISLVAVGATTGWQWRGSIGAALGVLVAVGGPFVVVKTLVYLEQHWWVGVPSIPSCRTGKCQKKDYILTLIGSDLVYTCRCGDKYTKAKGRFKQLMDDGSRRPYMRWKPFRKWEYDGQPSDAPRQ